MATFTYALDDAMPDACRGGVLTIGNFDGVHLGHQALLAEAASQARALSCPAIAVTFDPHPSQILRPDRLQPPLSTMDDRTVLLMQYGATHVLILKTTAALLQLTAADFFERIIVGQLNAAALIEGFNFRFGKDRQGTIDVLRAACAGKKIPLTLAPPCEWQGQPVSSSRVRTALLTGSVETVRTLLGRRYRVVGIVGTGQKRGATLGFPTANLTDVATLLPGDGVYAVRAIVDDKPWPAAANVGPNPTFGENARKVEVHLIGFVGDLYGKTVAVEFVTKVRDTKRFASVQELVAQIRADVAEARTALASEPEA
ncbi:MAG: bifunctional riboflavin kinase/FAD synthetase [Planctomycetes bacterium]|nr:bifunctional riboflavin kinase/FAD synthetase [Planctomycetota bacterium]